MEDIQSEDDFIIIFSKYIIMKLLELFSGTGGVGRVAKDFGFEVVSLDLKGALINTDILDWNYKDYPVGYLILFTHHHHVLNIA